MAIPRPFITLGISVYLTYRRRPGFDWRRISLMAGRRPSSYFSRTFKVPCRPSSARDTSRTKPSSRSTSQIFCLMLLAGRSTSSRPARWALRIRVSRSATGSVMLISCYLRRPYPWARRRCSCVGLPGRLDHSGDLALQGAIAKADAAHLELVQEGPAAPAQLAAVVGTHPELRLLLQALRLRHLRELGHGHAVRKGMPK